MQKEEQLENDKNSFAEKCRIALEKSYGSEVPLPQILDKDRKSWFKSSFGGFRRLKKSKNDNSGDHSPTKTGKPKKPSKNQLAKKYASHGEKDLPKTIKT